MPKASSAEEIERCPQGAVLEEPVLMGVNPRDLLPTLRRWAEKWRKQVEGIGRHQPHRGTLQMDVDRG